MASRSPSPVPSMPDKLLDFRMFLILVWRHLNLPDPTPIQLDIAHYLQHGPRRKVIEAFRGVGKSWITAAYVVWKLRQNPNLKFMVLSAGKDRADNFTTFCLRLIQEIPVLQCLIPRPEQRCSKVSFDVGPSRADHAPSVTSKGIFSQITGGRADEIISDDVEIANNSYTQMMRDKLSEAVKEFDAILKPGGTITYLGTPQTEQSLYNTLPDRGYSIRIWPARYPSEDQIVTSYGSERLAPYITRLLAEDPSLAGRTTDPRRFSDVDLLERELSYGRSGFQLQFMLDTRLSDAERYPLKLSDLIVMSCSPTDAPEKPIWAAGTGNVINDLPCVGLNGDRYYGPAWLHGTWIPYTGSVMAIDPSGRGKDETAVCVVKMLNGFLYVTGMKAYQDGYGDETLTGIAQMAKQHQVNHVIIEANYGDGMFTKLITPFFAKIHPCKIEEVKHSRQKEARIIDTLEPVMNQHRLIIDKSLITWDYDSTKNLPPEIALKYQLMYQMSRITRDRGSLAHDDRLDCLSMAVAYWVEQMAQDVDKRMAQRQEELIVQELRAWERGAKESKVKIGSGEARMDFTFTTTVSPMSMPMSHSPLSGDPRSTRRMGRRGGGRGGGGGKRPSFQP